MTSPTPELDRLIAGDPDLIDRIFEYILAELPEIHDVVAKLKPQVREEFRGETGYIAGLPATARQKRVAEVFALFDGRNATEVARRLQIGRATVYRYIKQAGEK